MTKTQRLFIMLLVDVIALIALVAVYAYDPLKFMGV